LGFYSVLYGLIASGVALVILLAVLDKGVSGVKADGNKGGRLRWILRSTHDEFFSLTSFQFHTWTIVFLFSLLWVYLVRVQGGLLVPIPALPTETLALMGINTASALGSAAIAISHPTEPTEEDEKHKDSFWYMLYLDGSPDLSRVQLFAWTVLSVIIYVAILFTQMFGHYIWGLGPISLQSLTIPNVDPSLVILMGLSHSAHIGVKYAKATSKNGKPKPPSPSPPITPKV
jgi:voltage-gated potassium channel Kch